MGAGKVVTNEFYQYVTTGVYPLDVPNSPAVHGGKKESFQNSGC